MSYARTCCILCYLILMLLSMVMFPGLPCCFVLWFAISSAILKNANQRTKNKDGCLGMRVESADSVSW